jgi:hypothetical protein
MNVGGIIKAIFYLSVTMLVLKGVHVGYSKYFPSELGESSANGAPNQFKMEFRDIKIPKTDEKSDISNPFAYDFKNMLALIEACEKVKYLEYLRFTRPKEASDINSETLQALIKAMHSEKSKLKKHIADIKSCSKESIPSKRLKALKYYLRVIEVNLQDLKGVAINKPGV